MGRVRVALAGFVLSACTGDPVYVLGRLPGSGGAGPAEDGGSGAGGTYGSGGSTPADGPAGDGDCTLPVPLRDYVFEGTGSALADRGGGAAGEIRGGAALDGSGELALDGEDDYVNLPNGVLAGLVEVSVAAWVRYHGGGAYTRIFDFGVGSDGEDPSEGLGTVGRSYLAAAPLTGFEPHSSRRADQQRGLGGRERGPHGSAAR